MKDFIGCLSKETDFSIHMNILYSKLLILRI